MDERNGEDEHSLEILEAELLGIKKRLGEIFQAFVNFYGDSDAKAWFQMVKEDFTSYVNDNRNIFRELSHLESERHRVEKLICIAEKRKRYSELSFAQLTEIVLRLEDEVGMVQLRLEDEVETCMIQQATTNKFDRNVIAAFGGMDISFRTYASSVALDLDTHQIMQLADLPTARSNSACMSIAGRVYVAGGRVNKDTWTTAFEVFDFASGRWSVLTSIPEVLEQVNGCLYSENILTWGTHNGIILIFLFETAKQCWTVIPSPPSPALGGFTSLGFGAGKFVCQIHDVEFVEVSQQFNPQKQKTKIVTDIRFYVLEMCDANLKWTLAGTNMSSVKTVLASAGYGLTNSKSFGTSFCIPANRMHPCQKSARNMPKHEWVSSTNWQSFVTFCLAENTYSFTLVPVDKPSHRMFERADNDNRRLLAYNDNCIIFHASSYAVIHFLSEKKTMHVDFYGREDLMEYSVALVNPSTACPRDEEAVPS